MKTHDIEQRSDEWFHIRKGKVTGTGLKSIMGGFASKESYFYQLIAERLTVGVKDQEETPMQRGLRLESEAVAAFEHETGKTVKTVGFSESDEDPAMAISPDGWIGDNEAIEVKCPEGKNYVMQWLKDEIPTGYYWQAIQYFVVNTKLKTLYFVYYNPDIPVHPLHIIEMKRDTVEESIKKAVIEQKNFLQRVNDKIKEIIKL